MHTEWYPDAVWVGERIRQLRERRGLSARALARRAGMSHANLLRIQGGGEAPFGQVIAIVKALEISFDAFFERTRLTLVAVCAPAHCPGGGWFPRQTWGPLRGMVLAAAGCPRGEALSEGTDGG